MQNRVIYLIFFMITSMQTGQCKVDSPLDEDLHRYIIDKERCEQTLAAQKQKMVSYDERGITEEQYRALQLHGYDEIREYLSKIIYHRPSDIDEKLWESLRPYFLPLDHPAKVKLDDVFKRDDRVNLDGNSLSYYGFTTTKPGKWSHTIVTTHPKIKGYLFKLFTDEQKGICDWEQWVKRIDGARSIKNTIETLGCKHLFKVPKKWIYPLPDCSVTPAGYERKNFILVVEDAHLVDENTNQQMWKTKITKHDLDIIHEILDLEGLHDTVYPFNLPYTTKGKLAFIDTEHHHEWPVRYHKLTPYLSKQNQHYWEQHINGK